MDRKQLVLNFQSLCAKKLATWKKYRKYALYRCTNNFVQWLNFEHSDFDVKIRPSYSIQALATQFPTIALTVGDLVRDQRGVEWWLRVDDWRNRRDEISEQIIRQIDPPALEPLTIEVVMEFLNRFQSNHEAVVTTRGIAAIVAGEVELGYRHLHQALEKYRSIPYEWARVEEARLTGWLSCTPENIVRVLHQEAEIGAQLLGLK